jgi:UDP-N-acetyl-2-amino-2-deoxyglucuronate dehydrogenase
VGLADQHSYDVLYFREYEQFVRNAERMANAGELDLVSICSPNYLHVAHSIGALRAGVDVLCEKPLVINPANLDELERVERETGHRVSVVLQLRLHPAVRKLKQMVDNRSGHRWKVELTYVTPRGPWFDRSWKGDPERSGGIASNIGIHLFDLLCWVFGPTQDIVQVDHDRRKIEGRTVHERADVRWFLSTDAGDLPNGSTGSTAASRQLVADGEIVDFSVGFTDLHTEIYRRLFAAKSLPGIADARPSALLVDQIKRLAG